MQAISQTGWNAPGIGYTKARLALSNPRAKDSTRGQESKKLLLFEEVTGLRYLGGEFCYRKGGQVGMLAGEQLQQKEHGSTC